MAITRGALAAAHDLDGLDGVREGQRDGDGGDLGGAALSASFGSLPRWPTYFHLIAEPFSIGAASNGTYEVLWSDQSLGLENVGVKTVTGTSYTIPGLTNGIAVVAYNQYGGGYPGGAPSAIPRMGMSTAGPVLQSVTQVDASDAVLSWTDSTGAASWWIYQSSPPNGLTGPFNRLTYPVQPVLDPINGTDTWTAGWLFQLPISEYAYEVQGCNGSYCTTLSNAVAVTPMSTSTPARPQAARGLTPEQMAQQAFYGPLVTPSLAAADAMRHPQLSAG